MDDILLYGVTGEEHDERLRHVLQCLNNLGMCKSLSNLSESTQPMCKLFMKEKAWAWCKLQQSYFNKVKEARTACTVLTQLNPNLEMVLSVDASSYALRTVLLQRQESRVSPRSGSIRIQTM